MLQLLSYILEDLQHVGFAETYSRDIDTLKVGAWQGKLCSSAPSYLHTTSIHFSICHKMVQREACDPSKVARSSAATSSRRRPVPTPPWMRLESVADGLMAKKHRRVSQI